MTYQEKSTQLACDASIAVQVLLGTSPGDMEFIPLKPQAANAEWLSELKARWPGRGLRAVGFVGLVDGVPQYCLKETLSIRQTTALESAFMAYLDVMLKPAAPIETEVEPMYDWSTRQYRLVPRH